MSLGGVKQALLIIGVCVILLGEVPNTVLLRRKVGISHFFCCKTMKWNAKFIEIGP
jgi:hypothetical protein